MALRRKHDRVGVTLLLGTAKPWGRGRKSMSVVPVSERLSWQLE